MTRNQKRDVGRHQPTLKLRLGRQRSSLLFRVIGVFSRAQSSARLRSPKAFGVTPSVAAEPRWASGPFTISFLPIAISDYLEGDGFVLTLAAFSALLPALRRSPFLHRHQSNEVC